MGTQRPLPKKGGTPPTFGPCLIVYCGQTAGWIKMPLGMDVGLSPGHIVLDRDPAPRNFWPMSVVAKRLDGSRCHLVWRYASAQATLCWTGNQLPLKGAHFYCGWMDQDATWYKWRPRPRPHCVTWGSSFSPYGAHAASQYSAHVYCGQTVAHLSYFWALVTLADACVSWNR